MIIARTFDAAPINAIVNDPSVYPWVCGQHTGPLDLSPVIADRRNVALFGEHGGMLFHCHQPGYYEIHTQVLPAGRGPWALAMAQACFHYMFCSTDAVDLITRCPKGNLGARSLARAVHLEKDFTNPAGWIMNGVPIAADIYSLGIARWIKMAAGLPARGHWFHERLEQEYAQLGAEHKPHADDETHDRNVGAALGMLLGGQPQKGVVFYNRWAAVADYQQIAIETLQPLTINIGEALLFMRPPDEFYVLEHFRGT